MYKNDYVTEKCENHKTEKRNITKQKIFTKYAKHYTVKTD